MSQSNSRTPLKKIYTSNIKLHLNSFLNLVYFKYFSVFIQLDILGENIVKKTTFQYKLVGRQHHTTVEVHDS